MVRRRSAARKKSARPAYVGSTLGPSGSPARRHGGWVVLILGALVVVNLYVFVWDTKTSVGAVKDMAANPALAIPTAPLALSASPDSADPGTGSDAAPVPVAPPGVIDGKVGKTDTLGRILKKSGLDAAEANEVIRSLTNVLDFRTIRQGQTYHLERGADGKVATFELVVSKLQKVRAVRNDDGALVGSAHSTQTKLEQQAIGGTISSTLYQALKDGAKGEKTAALVDFFVDVFAYDLDFYNDTHDGDSFRIVVEKELDATTGELLRYKRINAAEYRGKVGTFVTYNFDGKYYDAKGESSAKSLLKTPLKFARVSSGFDRKRMHPVLHTTRAHLGVDYAAPVGTPVWAAADGTITHRGASGGAGNLVMLRHASGVETAYMHLSKFEGGQKVGDKIAAKTVIGYVGTTGLSTGPHLHFGVKQHGAFIDPSKLAPMHGPAVPRSDVERFRTEVGKLDALMAGSSLP